MFLSLELSLLYFILKGLSVHTKINGPSLHIVASRSCILPNLLNVSDGNLSTFGDQVHSYGFCGSVNFVYVYTSCGNNIASLIGLLLYNREPHTVVLYIQRASYPY